MEWTKERHERAVQALRTGGDEVPYLLGGALDEIDRLAPALKKAQAIGGAWKAHSLAGQRMWTAQQAHDIPGVRKAVEDIENASEDLRVLGVDPDAENAR